MCVIIHAKPKQWLCAWLMPPGIRTCRCPEYRAELARNLLRLVKAHTQALQLFIGNTS